MTLAGLDIIAGNSAKSAIISEEAAMSPFSLAVRASSGMMLRRKQSIGPRRRVISVAKLARTSTAAGALLQWDTTLYCTRIGESHVRCNKSTVCLYDHRDEAKFQKRLARDAFHDTLTRELDVSRTSLACDAFHRTTLE